MNIKSMILREDFYRINESTLEKYFKSVYHTNVKVRTNRYSIRNKVVIYSQIGCITTRIPSIKVLRYWLNEYNIRNKPVRYIIAKLYVLACYFSFGFLADKGLSISNRLLMNRHIAIIPANRKIRIFHFDDNIVDAVVKDTFTRKYFNNELCFRLDCKYDFVPKIIQHGEDWYREHIIPGQALARVSNKKLYNKCINDAIACMGTIVNRTISFINATEYVDKLYNEIVEKMEVAENKKRINCYLMLIEIANSARAKAQMLNVPIPLAGSHGDLQTGNIWVDIQNEKTYIIDWETYDKRSVWYDCATLMLSTRRANMLRRMMDNRQTNTVKNAVLRNDNRKDYNMTAVMGVITLEEILFYLDDMLELPLDFGGDIFNRAVKELDMMGWRTLNEEQISHTDKDRI